MPNRVRVNYTEISNSAMQFHITLERDIQKMQEAYTYILSSIAGLDSATNAALRSVVDYNARKAVAAVDVLHKLILAITHSSRRINERERMIAAEMTLADTGGGA